MAGTYAEQYRPITCYETGADDTFNVGAMRDQANNTNNATVYSFAHNILAIPCFPPWYSHDNTTDERVIAMFMGTRVPEPYNKLAWVVGHEKTTESAGDDTVTWKLYSSEWRYYGDGTMDTTTLSSNYGSSSIVSDALAADAMPVPGTLDIVRSGGMCHLVLTAQNENVSTRGCIKSISIWPVLS